MDDLGKIKNVPPMLNERGSCIEPPIFSKILHMTLKSPHTHQIGKVRPKRS